MWDMYRTSPNNTENRKNCQTDKNRDVRILVGKYGILVVKKLLQEFVSIFSWKLFWEVWGNLFRKEDFKDIVAENGVLLIA